MSKIKQWTGTDHKQIQRVFVTTLMGTTPHRDVLHAAQNLLDFTYLAQYLSHTDDTLSAMQVALDDFHTVKDIFIDLECREYFNIPKLHSLQHYIKTIKNLGSLNGLNLEHSERLHINYAKKAYAASNRKDYTIQMAQWLQHQEAVVRFKSFLMWCTVTQTAHSLTTMNSLFCTSLAEMALLRCSLPAQGIVSPSTLIFPRKWSNISNTIMAWSSSLMCCRFS